MGQRGPKPLPEHIKVIRGTNRPSRRAQWAVVSVDGEIQYPTWVKGKARKFFPERVDIYELRGIDIRGCEEMLGHYANLHVLIQAQWTKGTEPKKGMLDMPKSYAIQFYDVPASQYVKAGNDKGSNPFLKNGKPPNRRRS